MILLDTHIVVWMFDDDVRLGSAARAAIMEADALVYSAISAWELGMLIAKQRLALAITPAALLAHARNEAGVREVAITGEIALDAGSMPQHVHGDPADRMLMATARVLGCLLLTADSKILDHAAAGHVRAVDARR